jgi:hypothetical protein
VRDYAQDAVYALGWERVSVLGSMIDKHRWTALGAL